MSGSAEVFFQFEQDIHWLQVEETSLKGEEFGKVPVP
ncbi:hypothetical protein CK203_086984 [Vitis vinifera]|uniref:Uncharacterized protein n=1 Tax=Vitis vinifera TaxID=29760 RepID=A0A438FIV8_VITVI|nr:hypothetical protein CK203_086984 [Vitis vinifera]